MKQIILSKDVLAFHNFIGAESLSIEVIPFETYGTEYGIFIPLSGTGYQFLRWIRNGMKDILPANTVSTNFIHVSNSGEVMVGSAFSSENAISMYPYCSDKFSFISYDRDVTEAFTAILKKCKTIAQAIKVIESRNTDGMYKPHIVLASDWVEYAKIKGFDKIFYHTRFNSIEE